MSYKNGDKAPIDNKDRVGNTIGSVGPIVKVTWWDAASTFKTYRINQEDPTEHLTICETVGEMVAKDDKAVVIVMHGSQCDGCDIMAIPRDWCQKIEILEVVGECIETSESQQESQNQKPEKTSNN